MTKQEQAALVQMVADEVSAQVRKWQRGFQPDPSQVESWQQEARSYLESCPGLFSFESDAEQAEAVAGVASVIALGAMEEQL